VSTSHAAPTAQGAALSVAGLCKSFGPNVALDGVSLTVEPGRVRGLLGANGAGKSTLIKILSGVYSADAGTVALAPGPSGEPGRLGFVHQDLGLVDALTIRENMMLGRRSSRRLGVFLDPRAERASAVEELARMNLDVDPETPLAACSLGVKSLVAVARMLAEKATVLFLDEVTAALTRAESDWLLTEVRTFVDQGGAAVVVSHRLHEVVEHCDDVTLLRNGQVVYDGPTPSVAELHELFISHGSGFSRDPAASFGPPAVRLAGVESRGVGPLDLEVRGGEVVSLVGPLASNIYSLGHVVAGVQKTTRGTLEILARDGGKGTVAFVPEDRRKQAVLPGLEVRSNLSVGNLMSLSTFGMVGGRREKSRAEALIVDLNVQPPNADYQVLGLSGGNQQKVVFGRAKMRSPDVYVLCEPTRGVDIATRTAMYEFIDQVSRQGAAVIILTIDVDDALAVGDRIGIVNAGRIESLRPRSQVTAAEVLEEAL
jgi:ribose transport system ATP-binding protein